MRIIVNVFVCFSMYAACAFIGWDWNPGNWGMLLRAGFVVMCLWLLIRALEDL